MAGFISTENQNIYSNDKNQNSTEDTVYALGQELAGGMQLHDKVDITTDRDQHNAYQNSIASDTVGDISFALENNGYNAMASTNSHVINNTTTTPSIFNPIDRNNAEFAGLDKELGDNLGWTGAAIGGSLTLASQIIPEIAKQVYQEDKNVFTMDYKNIYDKVDIVDIGAMAIIGLYTPNELTMGKSAKNIIDSATKYKKYTNLADKTNKNINKKIRFENKANDNVNTVVKELVIQSGLLGLKESLKENIDDEDLKGNN